MNSTLLINRLNTNDTSKEKHNIFFMIGEMDNPMIEDRLIDVIQNSKLVDQDEFILKYNGVELIIRIQEIPLVVSLLCKEGFSIYEVYYPYNPD